MAAHFDSNQLKWLKLLRGSGLIVLITGLSPVLAIFETMQEPWRLFYDLLTWPLNGQPSTFSQGERQLSAILGGVLCGWAWMIFCLAKPGVFNEKIRKLIVQSVWVWFILDSSGSIVAGLPLNAVSNMFFLLILIIPLRALKEDANPGPA